LGIGCITNTLSSTYKKVVAETLYRDYGLVEPEVLVGYQVEMKSLLGRPGFQACTFLLAYLLSDED
jgi:hypothetical protein